MTVGKNERSAARRARRRAHLVDDTVVVSHDERVAQLAQDVDFGDNLRGVGRERATREAAERSVGHLLLFALVHEPIVELLPHELLR